MADNNQMMLVLGLMAVGCLCVCSVASSMSAALALAGGDESKSPTPSSTTPSSTTPRTPAATLPSGSIKLINSETSFTSTNTDVPVANQPKASGGVALSFNLQPVQYTISFRIKNTGTTGDSLYREILQNYAGVSWDSSLGRVDWSGNSPLFFIPPGTHSGTAVADANKVIFRHLGADGIGYESRTNTALTVNTWHTVTAVADTNKLTVYIDGANPVTTNLPSGGTLRYRDGTGAPNNINNFAWNVNNITDVAYSIKDAYWWPRALTDTEVATVASVNSTSTSTYVPEPAGMGVSYYATY